MGLLNLPPALEIFGIRGLSSDCSEFSLLIGLVCCFCVCVCLFDCCGFFCLFLLLLLLFFLFYKFSPLPSPSYLGHPVTLFHIRNTSCESGTDPLMRKLSVFISYTHMSLFWHSALHSVLLGKAAWKVLIIGLGDEKALASSLQWYSTHTCHHEGWAPGEGYIIPR